MNAARAFAVSGLAIAGLAWSGPARAQTDYEAVVRLMSECARIAEIEARVACYDKTMEAARLIAKIPAAQTGPAPAAPVTEEPRAAARAGQRPSDPGRRGAVALRRRGAAVLRPPADRHRDRAAPRVLGQLPHALRRPAIGTRPAGAVNIRTEQEEWL